MTNTIPYSKSDTNKYLVLGLNVTLLQINIVYHIIMYSCNIGSHFEFQDGQQVLNNTRLNHIYDKEGLKPMTNYILILKVNILQKMLFFNSEVTKGHSDLSMSSLDSSSSTTWMQTQRSRLYLFQKPSYRRKCNFANFTDAILKMTSHRQSISIW